MSELQGTPDLKVNGDLSLEPQKFLTFKLDTQLYGVPTDQVLEINALLEITRVPNVPPFVKGVINLRGKVIPVIDLREKFQTTAHPFNKTTSVIVIGTDHGPVGVIVDMVLSVLAITANVIEAPPTFNQSSLDQALLGIAKIDADIIILINLRTSLSKENFEISAPLHKPH